MAKTIKILGISGSLRQGSFNTLALKNAQQLLPADATLEIFDLEGLPLFNQDLEKNFPPQVLEFKKQIRAADAILFATPEYNYSVSGILKNAIDWASRPYGDSAWKDKPAGILGASVGRLGTARAQYHLRQILVFLNMHALNQPEVMIGDAGKNFDDSGRLTDETSKKLIQELLQNLVDWTRRLQG